MEPEDLLLCLYKPTTGLYPEPKENQFTLSLPVYLGDPF
jgi:hypothetical protein